MQTRRLEPEEGSQRQQPERQPGHYQRNRKPLGLGCSRSGPGHSSSGRSSSERGNRSTCGHAYGPTGRSTSWRSS